MLTELLQLCDDAWPDKVTVIVLMLAQRQRAMVVMVVMVVTVVMVVMEVVATLRVVMVVAPTVVRHLEQFVIREWAKCLGSYVIQAQQPWCPGLGRPAAEDDQRNSSY